MGNATTQNYYKIPVTALSDGKHSEAPAIKWNVTACTDFRANITRKVIPTPTSLVPECRIHHTGLEQRTKYLFP